MYHVQKDAELYGDFSYDGTYYIYHLSLSLSYMIIII